MPNHVENIITLKGDEKKIREMLEAIKNDDYGLGTVDFNKIIPMPESLNIEAGNRTDRGLKANSDFIDVSYADSRKVTNCRYTVTICVFECFLNYYNHIAHHFR